ncbi:MAG: DUF2336 domain-containing protein [Verrucomicrobia bacterium]|nr:DUF2336 domain-containing protein [Verrucomicrobiota bacterium]
MIIRQFLRWIRTAPAANRAEAASALARAFLYSELGPDEQNAAEGALLMLLDDPCPLVRRALAQALASSPEAPRAVVRALAADVAEIAAIVLERSPVLSESELVDNLASGLGRTQEAIARRRALPRSVAAAIAEVGSAEACLLLIENPSAKIPAFSLTRIAERFGELAAIREGLFGRGDLPRKTRQALLVELSGSLRELVARRAWLEAGQAERVTREAREKVTVALAGSSGVRELRGLVRHLRISGQLNVALMLRALLSGQVMLFEQALAELSGVPLQRVGALVRDVHGRGLRALCKKAGLTHSAIEAVQAVLEALYELGGSCQPAGASVLKRRVIDHVLRRCEAKSSPEITPVLTLLRQLALEAAREEARQFCEELEAA